MEQIKMDFYRIKNKLFVHDDSISDYSSIYGFISFSVSFNT